MPAPLVAGNKTPFAKMLTVVRKAPFCLIPKELFIEEKIQAHWHVLYPDFHCGNIVKDELDSFYLLYPNSKNIEHIHEKTFLYNNLRKDFPQQSDAIGVNIYEEIFFLLILKERQIVHSAYYHFSVKEDILYHIANLFQHFFEDKTQIPIFYNQISYKILRFLKEYFEMKQL